MCKGTYSPKIREDLIPYLYKLSRHQGTHMTTLVNRYLEQLIDNFRATGIFTEIEQEERAVAALTEHFKNLLRDRKKKTSEVIELLRKIA